MKATCIFSLNYKGGVGKTTILADLAHNLAKKNRVLAIDTDPQGTLYTALGGDSENLLPLYASEDPEAICEFSKLFKPDSIKTFVTDGEVHERRREKPDSEKRKSNSFDLRDHFNYTYDVEPPAKGQFCYYPYFLFGKYGGSLWEVVERKVLERSCNQEYDFILIDLPPFRGKEVSAPIITSKERFSQLFPLIITEPSKEELRIADESRILYEKVVKNEGISLRTTPLWAINKCKVSNSCTFDGLDTRQDRQQYETMESFFDGKSCERDIFEFPQVDYAFTGHQSVSGSRIFDRSLRFEEQPDIYSPISMFDSDDSNDSLDKNANYRNYLGAIESLSYRIRNETSLPARKIGSISGLSPDGKSRFAQIYRLKR